MVIETQEHAMRGLVELGQKLACCQDLEELFNTCLRTLDDLFGYHRSSLMLTDESGDRLVTLASHGFAPSGIGSELPLGEGIFGVVAEHRRPVRLNNLTRAMLFGAAVRSRLAETGQAEACREIPPPTITGVRSLLAAPLVAGNQLVGVISVQSESPLGFGELDELTLSLAAQHMAGSIAVFSESETRDRGDEGVTAGTEPAPPAELVSSAPLTMTYYTCDDSVFIDGDYLIRGVAGRILRKLLRDYQSNGRSAFTNKEIRLDPKLRLPHFKDNLESRLILLKRRLEERCSFLQIIKSGRGQFRLAVTRPLVIRDVTEDGSQSRS